MRVETPAGDGRSLPKRATDRNEEPGRRIGGQVRVKNG